MFYPQEFAFNCSTQCKLIYKFNVHLIFQPLMNNFIPYLKHFTNNSNVNKVLYIIIHEPALTNALWQMDGRCSKNDLVLGSSSKLW
jgi:hypothetical protein